MHAAGGEQALADDLVEQLLGVVVELSRLGPLEDRGELPLQVPGVEKELPVDVAAQRLQLRLDDAAAEERRLGQVVEGHAVPVLQGSGVRE